MQCMQVLIIDILLLHAADLLQVIIVHVQHGVSEWVSGQRLNEGTERLQERWYGLQVTQAVIVRPSDWAAASTGSSRSTAGFSTPSRIPQRSSYRRVVAYAWRLSTCGCCDWPSHKMIMIILMMMMMMLSKIIMLMIIIVMVIVNNDFRDADCNSDGLW